MTPHIYLILQRHLCKTLVYQKTTESFIRKKRTYSQLKKNLFFEKNEIINYEKTKCNKLWKKKDNTSYCVIVRPLLSITRLDTKYISLALKLPIYPDTSNRRTFFLRNRLRKQILPAIRLLINPQFDTIFSRFCENFTLEKVYRASLKERIKNISIEK